MQVANISIASWLAKNRLAISYWILGLFHGFGLWGMTTQYKDWFVQATPLTLVICTALVFWNERGMNKGFIGFASLAFFTGYFSEVIGVHTQLLFGNYAYGETLGVKVADVPILIGINWFITVYASIHVVHKLLAFVPQLRAANRLFFTLLFAVLVGLVTTAFDYIMEPGAIRLGYWQWFPNNVIPVYNYVCWFIISSFIAGVFAYFQLKSKNQIVIALLFIQALFFIGIKIWI
jgi:bisanhydrobacterioruberin hydratase